MSLRCGCHRCFAAADVSQVWLSQVCGCSRCGTTGVVRQKCPDRCPAAGAATDVCLQELCHYYSPGGMKDVFLQKLSHYSPGCMRDVFLQKLSQSLDPGH